LIGRVTGITSDSIVILPEAAHRIAPLKPGDGVVFDAADWRSPEEPEEGGRVYELNTRRDRALEVRFANGALQLGRIRPGDLVWRTHDPALAQHAKPFLEPAAPVQKQPVSVTATAREGERLVTVWTLPGGQSVEVRSDVPLGTARNRALSIEQLRDQFDRLGNTPYQLAELSLSAEGSPFAPVSLLNEVRRRAVEKLAELQRHRPMPEIRDPAACLAALLPPDPPSAEPADPQYHLLVRTPEQLEAALQLAPASITLDYLDLYGLRPSIERVKRSGITTRVASPRVLKPGEARIVDFLVSLDCQILVRSTGILRALAGKASRYLIGDFSLNAANSIAARQYLQLGLSKITPTHDLNAAQVADLASRIGGLQIEAIAYQHLPVFHTEHCVFCRFLSTGTSYLDCGRPCEKHRIELRDQSGRAHPVMADVGCRNTVFGAEAQEASAHLDRWIKAGIRDFRLEFAHESGREVEEITDAFRNPSQLARRLKSIAPGGTTQGSLQIKANYLELPILQ
jgi:U32 family peptidase